LVDQVMIDSLKTKFIKKKKTISRERKYCLLYFFTLVYYKEKERNPHVLKIILPCRYIILNFNGWIVDKRDKCCSW